MMLNLACLAIAVVFVALAVQIDAPGVPLYVRALAAGGWYLALEWTCRGVARVLARR